MYKLGLYCPFGHLKHKFWSKERPGVKLVVRIQPNFLVWTWRVTYCWKALDKGYNFALDLIAIGGLHTKLWGPKSQESLLWKFRDSHLGIGGNPKTKCHLDVAPVERHKEYYKGEGGGFPQVWAAVSFVSPNCLWLVLTPKVFQLCTNHLVLVLCRSMWVSEACQFFLVPSQSSSTPLYPFLVLRAREHASTPYSSVIFCLGLTFESLKELGACQIWSKEGSAQVISCKYGIGPWNKLLMKIFITIKVVGIYSSWMDFNSKFSHI
jgi:hypothetical protein